MTFFLFLVAAVFSLVGLITGNGSLVKVGLWIWAAGLLTGFLGWGRRRRTFGSVEEAQAAAEAGNPQALRAVAAMAKLSGDIDKAEEHLHAAIATGDKEAMWDMGRLVEERDGLAASEPWFRMAAENGHFVAKRFFRKGSALNLDGNNPL
ncbi:hypothetical protein [Kribbella sp. NPDC023855]|uniref:hypothetical protein n=1 Tax=Kribbella sp. NPDC023855 TaxID=3154698 RepID=UPI0033E613AD